ncbi:uncharacterized protein LOC112183874 [Rosa chinensis]|uniref:uncharacterized protein LOC112183874 n=1 Tax=Rosa chinensis TaxID=74649 RepID=UPI000D089E44|nr:uncharacterized protein LOC112183874 [Rosa chinensis]
MEKRGFFTVKSAYWVAREQVLGNVLTTTSNGDPFRELWRRLWKANVPGKVHICVWRACSNLLPTRDRLLTKGYMGEVNCMLCTHRLEDTAHIFCKCPIALELLFGASFNIQSSLLPNLNFKEWTLEQALSLKAETFEKLMMIIWALWKNRNLKLWENRSQTATDMLFSCVTWLEEFQKTRKPAVLPVKQIRQKWKPAAANRVKINVDGAFLEQIPHGEIGGIMRDSSSQFIAAFTQSVQHVTSVKHVELLAIRAGIDLTKQLQLHQATIESDCLQAVQEIAYADYQSLDFGSVIDDIRVGMMDIQGVQICFAPRTSNKVAHKLANMAFDSGQHETWFGSVPNCILDIVQQETHPPI